MSPTPTTAALVLRFGHSPDPDDAFMFYGLAKGAVRIRDFRVEHVLHDIQTLNEMAISGTIEVTAISAHAYPAVADDYWIMHCGASMGMGYGPIVVALPEGPSSVEELAGRSVAIPGRLTTAYLVAQLYLPAFEAVVTPFDRIPDAVRDGAVDAGLVIHEGQITYGEYGLAKLADLGALWWEDTGLPLPLGLDVVRKDLGRKLASEVAGGLAASIAHAFEHEDDAVAYALDYGRGLDTERARTFVRMYVNEYTRDMGEEGRRALQTLFDRGARAGLISPVGKIEVI
ncbi:MAG: ABC transporter substrate-binding protein [Gemmatimonadetes bacterium]|nr:ABC transporter substrate-binding protein [Gemmatimonadota bacterium]